MDLPPGLRNPSTLFFQTDTTRRSIVASYWLVILLALPLWWHSTSIERLPLPSARVLQQVSKRISVPVNVCVEGASGELVRKVEGGVRGRVGGRWEGLDVRVHGGQCVDKAKEDAYIVTTGPHKTLRGRRLTYPLSESHLDEFIQTLTALVAPTDEAKSTQNRVVQFSPRYRLAFSLLNEDASAGSGVMSWDVQRGIRDHIQPILTALSPLHNFTIESQVQYYAPLAFDVQASQDGAYALSYEDLTVFVNSAEWTLSSSASNDPVLHFLLFVPSTAHTPLRIRDSKATAFLLPQWGGVSIYNANARRVLGGNVQDDNAQGDNTPHASAKFERLSDRALDRAFATFATQLVTLLGIPELPAGVASEVDKASSATAQQKSGSSSMISQPTTPNTKPLTQWQLDALTRRRILETAQATQDTLRSFVKLAGSIENMPVRADVRDDIVGAVGALEEMYASTSHSLTATFTHAAHASTLASRAFFNPGMLALLYFPAEHKYAVYAPLFASAVIPLFVAGVREVRGMRVRVRG